MIDLKSRLNDERFYLLDYIYRNRNFIRDMNLDGFANNFLGRINMLEELLNLETTDMIYYLNYKKNNEKELKVC